MVSRRGLSRRLKKPAGAANRQRARHRGNLAKSLWSSGPVAEGVPRAQHLINSHPAGTRLWGDSVGHLSQNRDR
jgi:hypothetical protein